MCGGRGAKRAAICNLNVTRSFESKCCLCRPGYHENRLQGGPHEHREFYCIGFVFPRTRGRDFHVQASGQFVRIQAQAPRRILGDPLRIDDGTGRSACYDDTGELTVNSLDKFYGTSITAKFHFDGNGVMTDTTSSIASHPQVLPIPTTTQTVQTVGKEAKSDRVRFSAKPYPLMELTFQGFD
jgi:hypothetical protein